MTDGAQLTESGAECALTEPVCPGKRQKRGAASDGVVGATVGDRVPRVAVRVANGIQ